MNRLLLILLISLISCKTAKESFHNVIDIIQVDSISSNSFLKFISLLPKLNLPFQTNCFECCDHPSIDYNNQLIKQYLPEGSAFLGIIQKTKDKVSILITYPGDIIIPSIKVYNLEGILIDERNFMTNYCGEDFDYFGKLSFSITSDYTICAIDTFYTFKMDSITNQIVDTIEIKTLEEEFRIDENGKILNK